MKSNTTTILFVISRGLVKRNLLRSGVLERLLQKPETRIVIAYLKGKTPMPEYLQNEFKDERIRVVEVEEKNEPLFSRKIWKPIINNLVYTKSTDLLAREGSAKVKPVPAWWYPFHRAIFSFLSKQVWLKSFVRRLELILFPVHEYDSFFHEHRPSVVVCGSVISKYDQGFLRAAKRHSIPTVGMQKGWDNLERQLIRVIPDVFLLQNRVMVEAAEHVQAIPKSQLRLVGFPQFDVYSRFNELPSRREILEGMGIPPSAKFVMFGSEGLWTPTDERVLEDLLSLRSEGKFPFDLWFTIRPHFSDVFKMRYEKFRGREGLYVDDQYRWGTYFADSWDPSEKDMKQFNSQLKAADALICIASTLSLDAASCDIPILNISYGARVKEDGADATSNLYRMDHYRPVLESDGVELVHSKEELRAAIVKAVEDPGYRTDGRERLLQTMCGPLDGRAAERIVHEVLQIAKPYEER